MITKDAIFWNNWKIFVFILLSLFLLLFVRSFVSQIIYLSEAEKIDDKKIQGESIYIEKIKRYERVILFHFPLSPMTKTAINEMMNICEKMSLEGKLYCYETLRADINQIRSFYTPYDNILKKINPIIAELRTKQMFAWKFNNLPEQEYEIIKRNQQLLIEYESISPFWGFIAPFSLLGWITTVFITIWRGLNKSINKKITLLGVVFFLFFFILWIVGLIKA